MKKNQVKKQQGMINLITLFSFLFGLVLIIFLKHQEGKGFVHLSDRVESEKSGVKKLPNKISNQSNLNDRQQRILAEIKKQGTLVPSKIYSLVGEVSSRTLRRDMDLLVEKGLVRQDGATKSTSYIYVGN